tara:strand:+ start:48 stop:170 length:123 start_codon:yes stop_codon:yes gene_type:complete
MTIITIIKTTAIIMLWIGGATALLFGAFSLIIYILERNWR